MVKMKLLDVYLSQKDFIIKPALEELVVELEGKVKEAEILDGGVVAIDIIKDRKKQLGSNNSRPLGQIGIRANKGNNIIETVVFALVDNEVVGINLNSLDSEIIDIKKVEKEQVKKITSRKLGL